jgi:hypothetical protein
MPIELDALESKFQKARTEYKTLMETIQMSCLGDKYAKECSRASTLNVEMQNYLIQMSSLVKPFPKKRKEYLDFTFQLEDDLTLLQQETDSKVFADMNYANAMTWFFVSLTVIGVLLYKN